MTEILGCPYWLPCLSQVHAASVWPGLKSWIRFYQLLCPLFSYQAFLLFIFRFHFISNRRVCTSSAYILWWLPTALRIQPVSFHVIQGPLWSGSGLSSFISPHCLVHAAELAPAVLTAWKPFPHIFSFVNLYPRKRFHWCEREIEPATWVSALSGNPTHDLSSVQDDAPPNWATLARAPPYL